MRSQIWTWQKVAAAMLVLFGACAPHSGAWTACGIAPAALAGGAIGIHAYSTAVDDKYSVGGLAAASVGGAAVAGIGGYFLGECARDDNLACEIGVVAANSLVGAAAFVGVGILAVRSLTASPIAITP